MRTLALAGLVLLAGCSPRETLSSYPTRLIDRPYTQPKGVTSWHTQGGYQRASSSLEGDTWILLATPLVWQTAHTDNLNTIWAPIPAAISYQFQRSREGWIGGTVVFGSFTLDERDHLAWIPQVITTAHLKLTPSLALDLDLGIGAEVITSDDLSSRAVAGRVTGLVQSTDRLAVFAGAAFVETEGPPDPAPFVPAVTFDETPEPTGPLVPIHGGMFVSFSRQWEAWINFTYSGTGYPEDYGYEAWGLEFSLSHLW